MVNKNNTDELDLTVEVVRSQSLLLSPTENEQYPYQAGTTVSFSNGVDETITNDINKLRASSTNQAVSPISLNNSTVESKFDADKHCRYCFGFMSKDDNHSSCLCSGLLCANCLQKELALSWNRSIARDNDTVQLNCTVCKYQYGIQRTKLDIEKSCCTFFQYFLLVTFPTQKNGGRDMSIFDNWLHLQDMSSFVLPITTARTMLLSVFVWIFFVLICEIVGGYNVGDGRVICFLFDTYLLLELLRITHFFDFPERIWISFVYFMRSVVFVIWSVFAFIESRNNDLLELRQPMFNWKWLSLYVVVSCFAIVFEARKYTRDLKKRAMKQDKNQVRVSITSADGIQQGPFIIPKQQENEIAIVL